MLGWTQTHSHHSVRIVTSMLLAVATLAIFSQSALALITGGEGNKPISDPGWPQGAAAIFNNSARVAWWEGPPFGGGQWHAECRGDATAFNAVIADFAKLEGSSKKVVVHSGKGTSFWLSTNGEKAKKASAQTDWVFMVWQPSNWNRFHKMPADLRPGDVRDTDKDPPSQIDVFAGGNIRWADVVIPAGLQIVDERLEAHGFTTADGKVIEGQVFDAVSQQPIAGRALLQRVEPQSKGGYRYTTVNQKDADAQGRWVIKNAPAGWHQIVVEADGYVSRVAGYVQSDDQPGWQSYRCRLSRTSTVSGQITDEAGKPLADVDVRLADVTTKSDGRYESPNGYETKSDADGRFSLKQVPIGSATIRIHKPGYCRPGLGQSITTPIENTTLSMIKAASVRVTVDFGSAVPPAGYVVHMAPEGGSAIGKWSGSGNIDAKNQIAFGDVPPGRYVLHGQPNPGSANQKSKSVTIDLKGGQPVEVTLTALKEGD